MKLRCGFVSNSSSSSFIVISKEDIKDFAQRPKSEEDRYVTVRVEEGTSYCRSDIMLCESLEDKIKYVVALYAIKYQSDESYFAKMEYCRAKLCRLGRKYGYILALSSPPLRGELRNRELEGSCDETSEDYVDIFLNNENTYIDTYINVSTECLYIPEIVKLVENEDTTELESFLFNPHSFGVLGGDEYSETDRLAYKMRKAVDKAGYEYRKFGDDAPDHDIGDPLPYVGANGETTYDYAYHWGKYRPESRLVEFLKLVRYKLRNMCYRLGYCVRSIFHRW